VNQKLVRYQLIAFVIVTVLGIGYAMASYVHLGPILGFGQYRVSVDLPSAGGLYSNAAVTQNGVTIGKVDDIHLTKQGVVADLSINNGTKIPSALHAAVANTSAIGEQYVNFTATSKTQGGPYLASGAVIPTSEVSLPPNTSSVLANVSTLLQSVPKAQLSTTINELYNGFNGTGPQLRQLLTSSGSLLNAASQNIAPTKNLINESNPVLNTQARNAANIKAFAHNLDEFTTQLRDSNGDLTGTIDKAPGLTTQLDDLIGQLQPTVPMLLTNLTSVGEVAKVYLPNVQEFLIVFPAAENDLESVILNSPKPGEMNMNLLAQVGQPCTTGYPMAGQQRQPTDTAPKAAPTPQPYCTLPHTSQTQVRSAHNYPCPNNPSLRGAFASDCGLNFTSTAAKENESGSSGGSSGAAGSTSGAAYDPSTGLLVGPGGLLYSVGANSVNGTGPNTLAGLMHQTLGGS